MAARTVHRQVKLYTITVIFNIKIEKKSDFLTNKVVFF